MPTSTFFRLPEEKRQRLIEVAWVEFTDSSFSDVSINRIVGNAGIPRGSFYQYFTGKDDLFFYLLSDLRQHFEELMEQLLTQAGGDLFALTGLAFDELLGRLRAEDLDLVRCIRIMQMNRGLDLQRLTEEKRRFLTDGLWERIRLDGFRDKNRDAVENVFFLLIMALTSAMMEVLREPEQTERQRARLDACVEIIRIGSTEPDWEREGGTR